MAKKIKQKILFVSHKANRSGAPLLFLEIIKEFKKRSEIPFQILIIEDGDLSEEFKSCGKTYTWHKKKSLQPKSLPEKMIAFFLRIQLLIRAAWILFCVRNTSLVFFNTISNGHIHKKLLFLKCKFICYVHELEAAIHILTNQQTLDVVLNNTHLFLACSGAVKKNLIINHQVEKEIIKVVNYSLNEIYRDKKNYAGFITSFRDQNMISANAVIIGVAGSNEWRKGFDLFLPLTSVYFNLFPESNVYFIWKGFKPETASSFFDVYDYKKFNTNRTLLLPHGNDSIENIACFDIHLLLSREDPYPLVVLEAASFGIPTVCFADAGGSREFIEDDCGYSVRYGDLIEMSVRLNGLVQDACVRNTMGLKAQEKLQARHAHENAMPQFIDILKN